MSKKISFLFLEFLFLVVIYLGGLYFRLLPRLEQDPHLLTFEADIWYRITMAQNLLDHGHLPKNDIRYEAYSPRDEEGEKVPPSDVPATGRSQSDKPLGLTSGGGKVPFWYPPLSLYFYTGLAKASEYDLPEVSSRIVPFFESLAPLSIYIFCRVLLGRMIALISTLFLALTPSFVFWSGISDPQSFILFMIPMILLLWIKHAQWNCQINAHSYGRYFRILILGILLGVCFLTHLFYFLMIFILFFVTLGFFVERKNNILNVILRPKAEESNETNPLMRSFVPYRTQDDARRQLDPSSASGELRACPEPVPRGLQRPVEGMTRSTIWLDLFGVIILSQVLTSWWWAPQNLYRWWMFHLVTSSGLYSSSKQLSDYGTIAAISGIYALIYVLAIIVFRRKNPIPFAWIAILWAIPPLIESQNENILLLFGKEALTWSTLFKPLEAFRFYCFAAQPMAILFGMMAAHILKPTFILSHNRGQIFILPLIFIFLYVDITEGYNFSKRIKNSGFTIDEIRAAQWYKKNSKSTDRIIADYYRSYMFSGYSGGRALLGMAFPLRGVDFPYISKEDYTVPEDIYRIYTTDNPEEAIKLMKRYGATHLFVSANMSTNGNFISKTFGIKYNFTTLQNPQYFRAIYQEKGKSVILERLK